MDFETDKFFNIYEVGNKLGHGHFAEVKHCTNKNDKTEYAAKFIRRRQLLDAKHVGMNLEEIEREAHILKMLNHQNIIKIFFCYDLGKNIVLLLELVSGGELFDHISDSEKLSEEEASEFVEQIVLGLHHMHERNIVHLDLKPENVMIENLVERKIKLIDFGLARVIKNKNTVIEMQGTAEFLAPEVIEYNPISYATDMWAIGVITYIMLTGVSPFSGDDQVSTFQNIVNCRLEFDEDICNEMSEMAKSFINTLLIFDAKKRARASDCLVHPWIKPMEQSIVFRRRSSIISKDKLQSLKNFVICPSPPSSGDTTPRSHRRYLNDDFLEDVEESLNDDDDQHISFQNNDINTSNSSPSSTSPNHCDKNPKENQNELTPVLLLENNKFTAEARSSDTDSKLSCTSDDTSQEHELSDESNQGYQNGNSVSIENKTSVTEDKVKKPKNNNIISNSVRKLSSKIESITSRFDYKSKSGIQSKTQSRGSLKNLFTINTDSVFSSQLKKTTFSPTITSHASRNNFFNSKPMSASVATSPTIYKKSMFFDRYVAALESKKK